MSFPAFTEKTGALSAIGLAKETSFGTVATATNFFPFKSTSLDPEPGLFSPAVMMQSRDKNIFPLYGQYKFVGNVGGPLFPTNGIPFFVYAIGTDIGQTGTAAPTAKNGTIATASAGATSLTYTVTNGTPAPTSSDIFQISTLPVGSFGNNNFTGTNSQGTLSTVNQSMVVRPSAVTGSGPYTLTVPPIPYAITSGQNNIAQAVIAPFYHTINQANLLSSMTIEKDLGGGLGTTGVTGVPESIQYRGTRVGKYSLKLGATNTEAEMTADLQAQTYTILGTPTTPTYVNETPFVFAEATLTLGTTTLNQATNISWDLDNGLKPNWTFSNAHVLSFLTPVTRAVTGKFDVVFDNFDDATYGYFNQIINTQPQAALTISLVHPASPGGVGAGSVSGNEAVSIYMPAINLAKYADKVSMEDVIVTTLDYTAFFNLSNTFTIQAIVANNQSSNY